MCENNFATMILTTPVVKEETKEDKNRREGRITELLEYATTQYGCEFSEGFEKELYSIQVENFKVPKLKAIDALVEEWYIWRPYVTRDSFSRFIEDGIKSMIQIHTTATFCSPVLNGYIGEKATVIKELPLFLATTVSLEGILCRDGKTVGIA